MTLVRGEGWHLVPLTEKRRHYPETNHQPNDWTWCQCTLGEGDIGSGPQQIPNNIVDA